jgi:tRNA G26 N,N-dimethylase Trm1
LEVTTKDKFICPNTDCNETIEIENLSKSMERIPINEKAMGDEYANTVKNYTDECPYCGSKFKITGSVYEYPVGSYYDSDITIQALEEYSLLGCVIQSV